MTPEHEEIFNKIYRSYYSNIVGFCNVRLNDDAESAQDITDKVFFILSVKWDTLKSHTEAAIVAWIYSTAKNLINNHLREMWQNKKMCISLEEYAELGGDIADNSSPLDPVTYDAYIKTIEKELSAKELQLFNYVVHDKYSNAEIALILNMNATTVKTRWRRLRKKLQKILKKFI